MKIFKLLAAAVGVLLLAGCATIVSDSDYMVSVSSNPSAAFTITDANGFEVYSGETPADVLLPASDGFFSGARYILEFKSEDGNNKRMQLKARLDGWVIGNIFLGGIIGLAVDASTGAMFLLPEAVHTNLESADATSLKIVDVASLSPEQRDQLIELEI